LQLSQPFMGSVENVGGQRLLQLAVQSLGMPEGKEAADKLSTPLEDAALGVSVAITATSGSANKEVQRQGYLALLQLAGSLGPQFIQLMQMASSAPGTPAGDEALQAARGMKELYARVLEQYDIRNADQILPLVEAAQPGGNGAQPAGARPLDPSLAAILSGVPTGQ